MWTLLQLPCLTLPHGAGPSGLPLGVQVIGRFGEDAKLFVAAQWIRQALESAGTRASAPLPLTEGRQP
jgi:Asp-tRNA(Asn)/Glu-tRNA(Gln) amidotransferase A subunit family amidase